MHLSHHGKISVSFKYLHFLHIEYLLIVITIWICLELFQCKHNQKEGTAFPTSPIVARKSFLLRKLEIGFIVLIVRSCINILIAKKKPEEETDNRAMIT